MKSDISEAHSLDALNLLLGLFFVVIFLTVSLIVHFMIRYGFGGVRNRLANLLRYLIIFLFIVSIVMGIGDATYSVYIASQVYRVKSTAQIWCSILHLYQL